MASYGRLPANRINFFFELESLVLAGAEGPLLEEDCFPSRETAPARSLVESAVLLEEACLLFFLENEEEVLEADLFFVFRGEDCWGMFFVSGCCGDGAMVEAIFCSLQMSFVETRTDVDVFSDDADAAVFCGDEDRLFWNNGLCI